MTPADTLARTRAVLVTGAVARALLIGLAAGVLTQVLLGLYAFSGALGVGVAAAAAMLWRSRAAFSRARSALWVEERLPSLGYSFVTAVDPRIDPSRDLLDHVRSHDILPMSRRAVLRSLSAPAALAIAALAVSQFSQATGFVEPRSLSHLVSGRGTGDVAQFALSPLRATVTPPAYTGRQPVVLRDPLTISALARSVVTVEGPGRAGSVTAIMGATRLPVRSARAGWSLRFAVGDAPAALVLASGDSTRHIVVDPRADEGPVVSLLTPVRDTTLRQPRLAVSLDARVRDDIGLARGYFEYLISSGAGESFTARVLTTPVRVFGGRTRGELRDGLDVSTLKLSGGDVVSMRAVAFDLNTATGPSMGTSETRTIRIARADEYDSISVEAAAPPPLDSSAMSQRMLIIMTEELVKRRRRISRAQFVEQSTDIGRAEDRIRKRVYDILYETDSPEEASEHEEEDSEVRSITNRDLKQAYDALWDAVRSLQIAEPERALPPMRIALEALDRARLAQRLYLRGRPPRVVVDIGRVRLTGKDKGESSVRAGGQRHDSTVLVARRRFSAALDSMGTRPAEAVANLALLRADVLRALPEFALALEGVIAEVRAKRDPAAAISRARRSLQRVFAAPVSSPAWSGG